MTEKVEYVSASTLGTPNINTGRFGQDTITISLFGPKGGTRCIESLSLEEATLLHKQLGMALGRISLPDDGTSGQDRDSYSDTQDRDSYTVDP